MNVPSALTISSAPDGSVIGVSTMPTDTAVTANVPPSGSLSGPKPLLLNKFPATARARIKVFSVVATASGSATAGSSWATILSVVVVVVTAVPSVTVHVRPRVRLAPKSVGLWFVDWNVMVCSSA